MTKAVRQQVTLPLAIWRSRTDSCGEAELASYAANIIDTEQVRCGRSAVQHRPQSYADADGHLLEYVRQIHRSFSDGYGCLSEALTAASLANKPDKIQCILYRTWCQSAAKFFWKEGDWTRFPSPASPSEVEICRSFSLLAFIETPATAFLTAHPSVVSRIYDKMWMVMLLRHLGVRVFDDTASLRCAECNRPMDHIGDHTADLYKIGLGNGQYCSSASIRPTAVQGSRSRRSI